MKVIAREAEQERLRSLMYSKKPELVAVYGRRRRVGKTYLVSNVLREDRQGILFELTGTLKENGKPISKSELIMDFNLAYYAAFQKRLSARSVEEALEVIVDLAHLSKSTKKNLYLFLDELPWLAKSSPELFR